VPAAEGFIGLVPNFTALEGPMARILIVDDQKDVRAMIAIVLRIRQFEIVEAESAAAGLKAFEAARFDLTIVDMFLNDGSGVDVIAAMRERVPGLPVVAISGMTPLDFVSGEADLTNVVCLQKPFRPNDLTRAINAAFRSAGQAAAGVA
jgi:DNA-binding NtrC family response regulator